MRFLKLINLFFIIIILQCFCSRDVNEAAQLYSEGLKHYSINDLKEAEKFFTSVIKLDKGHFNALLMLTKISYYNKDYLIGTGYADLLIKKSPMHSSALYWKARCLIMANPDSTEEPVNLLQKSLESNSDNLKARQLLALIYEREGKYKEALHHYFEALKDEETLLNLRVNLALMYNRLGLKDKGIEEINRAIKISMGAGIPEGKIKAIKEEIK